MWESLQDKKTLTNKCKEKRETRGGTYKLKRLKNDNKQLKHADLIWILTQKKQKRKYDIYELFRKLHIGTSSQDGDIGRYILPPCTTKRRTTTNLKTKNNQNCQKIELYGSLTTKKLKKKHSSILVGGSEMGSWG